MARIFITGSADGLGQMAAKLLASQGHQIVLHARNSDRAKQAISNIPNAEAVVTGDLASIEETKKLAATINEMGSFDAIIHNAGVYQATGNQIFAVNTLAPYILTCLIEKPKRLIYLSSGMHLQGDPSLRNLEENIDKLNYSDSKLHLLMLANAVARKWLEVYSNTVNPGWVATKMGGVGASDNLEQGFETQSWLAVSNDEEAKVSGQYFYHKKYGHFKPEANNIELQEKLLALCQQKSGVKFTLK